MPITISCYFSRQLLFLRSHTNHLDVGAETKSPHFTCQTHPTQRGGHRKPRGMSDWPPALPQPSSSPFWWASLSPAPSAPTPTAIAGRHRGWGTQVGNYIQELVALLRQSLGARCHPPSTCEARAPPRSALSRGVSTPLLAPGSRREGHFRPLRRRQGRD